MTYRSVAHALLLLLGTLALGACETTPKVGVDFNPQYSFAGKTRVAVIRPQVGLLNDLAASRLESAIQTSLGARGYTLVPPAQAELWVSFFVTTQNKADVQTYNTGFSYRRCWDPMRCAGWANPQVDVRYYNEGTLMIDVIDPATKALQWRGTTTKRLPSKPSPSERDKLAAEVVGAILAQFPPGS